MAPPEPLVSTFIKHPLALAAVSRPSAAMYVWAIPVGHDVTAKIFVKFSFASPVSANLSSILFFSSSAWSIISRNSSTLPAFLNESEKFWSIIITDNLLKTLKCTLSSVLGAAIKKSNVTGASSNASKSTPFLTTIAASPGLSTASHFPWGIPIPSPIPVVLSSSLA